MSRRDAIQPRPRRFARRVLRAAGALALLAATACGPRLLVQDVSSSENLRVVLRRTEDGGQVVPRGYAHPATMSDVRLAHILANLEHRDADGRRSPTIRSESVYELAEALNAAIAKAGPDDEIAAVVYPTNTRLALFTEKLATSFRLYFRGDELTFEFFDIERPLEPGEGKPGRDDKYEIPTTTPPNAPRFSLIAPPSTLAEGDRLLHVSWRDPYFSKPVSLRVRAGRFRRRAVLMESDGAQIPGEYAAEEEAEAAPELPDEPAPAGLRDAQLRALDQLDALRRSGLIKEVDFQRRRRMVIEGKLEEAGYPPAEQ